MVSANIIRECWQAVVASHREGIATTVQFSENLDHDNDQQLSQNIWFPPQVQRLLEGRSRKRVFTIDTLFEDNHEGDRSTDTVTAAYERQQVLADQCLSYFEELYVDQETIYQGVTVRLKIEGPATMTALWDTAGKMTTGCRLSGTFSTLNQFCASDYFNS